MSSSLSSTSSPEGDHPSSTPPSQTIETIQNHQDNPSTSTSIELKDLKKIDEEQAQEKVCITVNTHNEEQTKIEDEDDEDDDACSDADSIVVHFARRFVTKPLTLSSIKPQQQQYRMSRAQNNTPQTPGDKRVSFAQPQKPTVESIFSKTTAKSGKSTVSSVTFRIPTCCGIIELNLVRILSLFGMLINIAAFIAVAVIVGNAFKLDAQKETYMLLKRTDYLQLYHDIDCTVRVAAATGNQSLVGEYYIKRALANTTLVELALTLPNGTVKPSEYLNTQITTLNDLVMDYVAIGDMISAREKRKSFQYYSADTITQLFLIKVQKEIVKLANEKKEYLRMASAVNMGLVLFGVIVSVPIVILIFAMALTTEVTSTRKLRKAAHIMIMETVGSDKYNALFRAFCDRENCLDSFTLLDNCHSYKELCEEAHYLRGVAEQKSKNTKISDIEEIEKVEELERNKYEVAFKIFTEFIDVNGETPFKTSTALQERVKTRLDEFSSSSILEDDLFDELQKSVCESMAEPFMKFKQEIKQKKKRK
ncbi:RGS-domain-containing protein [Naegleria gruberi]|uniref:RGS-domain-containing protein n=1 Tax=Naegleria gruberi TaxID=5762 RepID=D2V992_NAEGR|nr:RGS-domain-containing protein [Naegleria gruberi]EFC46670.1 RGS-domain-containing protein [Naegleria gruberi]|eukprot:XP_002679414.1 RGS-domain-containing protein [Naegleria gruberi strain NEG-M]